MSSLRVAFVAGTLGQGGAEKQLAYMVRALVHEGVAVRVYSLTQGEHYEPTLKAFGAEVVFVGRHANPLARLASLAVQLRRFRPHVLQSVHFYTNLYVGALASLVGTLGVGAIRSDLSRELKAYPFVGKALLKRVGFVVANSQQAERRARCLGVDATRVFCLPNVIDLAEFDRARQFSTNPNDLVFPTRVVVGVVGRLIPAKRIDRFIEALALARQEAPELLGLVVGDGPEAGSLRALARHRGLLDEHLLFLGERDDVPAILGRAQMLALTSDHEGFANVLLEAMAARLPVLSTPAGDSGLVVVDGKTGYVIEFGDLARFADRMVHLARSPELREQMGHEGRTRVKQEYGPDGLARRLFEIYRHAANQQGSRRLSETLRSI